MNKGTYFRLLALCLLAASILSAISMFCLTRLADYAAARHRGDFLMFVVSNIEKSTDHLKVEDLKSSEAQSLLEQNLPNRPPMPAFMDRKNLAGKTFPRPPPPPFGFPGRPAGPPSDFWLVSEHGEVFYSSRPNLELPQDWASLPHPAVAHEIAASQDFFRLSAGIFVIKLHKEQPLYLVTRENRNPSGPLIYTQAFLTFGTVLVALFFALTLVFFYLRKKSQEARVVLLKMEQGDLKARFDIKRFDQFSGLLVDFNRMAKEIERLVSRIRETETARKNLLQELGHDLRTPLTSLRTSFETLRLHFTKMTEADRADLFEMIEAEVAYFGELLEKLMTMADLDEPHYKKSTEWINLEAMVRQEVTVRENTGAVKIDWIICSDFNGEQPPMLMGDNHLLLRLLKNAFDNALRYTKTRIEISILRRGSQIEIQIRDDGPGLTPTEISNFAQRRDKRTVRQGVGLNFSLGLGSVIMKTIVELHGGTLEMKNDPNGGAILTLSFPMIQNETKNLS